MIVHKACLITEPPVSDKSHDLMHGRQEGGIHEPQENSSTVAAVLGETYAYQKEEAKTSSSHFSHNAPTSVWPKPTLFVFGSHSTDWRENASLSIAENGRKRIDDFLESYAEH